MLKKLTQKEKEEILELEAKFLRKLKNIGKKNDKLTKYNVSKIQFEKGLKGKK